MNLKEFNNLTDLFFYQAERQNPDDIFLEWLNTINRKKYKSTKLLNSFKFILSWWAKRESNSHSIATTGF